MAENKWVSLGWKKPTYKGCKPVSKLVRAHLVLSGILEGFDNIGRATGATASIHEYRWTCSQPLWDINVCSLVGQKRRWWFIFHVLYLMGVVWGMELFRMMIFWFIASGLAMKMMRLQSKESVETAILKHSPSWLLAVLDFWKWFFLSLSLDDLYKEKASCFISFYRWGSGRCGYAVDNIFDLQDWGKGVQLPATWPKV